MKKEIFAAVVLVFLASVSAWNLHYSKELTNYLIQTVEASLELAQQDRWQEAARFAETAVEKWNNSDSYIHVFMSHTEVDLAADAFGDYLGELYRNDLGGARGAHQRLVEHISTMYELERISLKSIF